MILEALEEVVGIVPDEVLLSGLSLDVLDDEVVGFHLNLVERHVVAERIVAREDILLLVALEAVERDGHVVLSLPYILDSHHTIVASCCLIDMAATAVDHQDTRTERLVLRCVRVQAERHRSVHLVADRVGQDEVRHLLACIDSLHAIVVGTALKACPVGVGERQGLRMVGQECPLRFVGLILRVEAVDVVAYTLLNTLPHTGAHLWLSHLGDTLLALQLQLLFSLFSLRIVEPLCTSGLNVLVGLERSGIRAHHEVVAQVLILIVEIEEGLRLIVAREAAGERLERIVGSITACTTVDGDASPRVVRDSDIVAVRSIHRSRQRVVCPLVVESRHVGVLVEHVGSRLTILVEIEDTQVDAVVLAHLSCSTEQEVDTEDGRRCAVDDTEDGIRTTDATLVVDIHTHVGRRSTVVEAYPARVVGRCAPFDSHTLLVVGLCSGDEARSLRVVFHHEVEQVEVGCHREALRQRDILVLRQRQAIVRVLEDTVNLERTIFGRHGAVRVVARHLNIGTCDGIAGNILHRTRQRILRQGSHRDVERRCFQRSYRCLYGLRLVAQCLHVDVVIAGRQVVQDILTLSVGLGVILSAVDQQQSALDGFASSVLHHTGDVAVGVFRNLHILEIQTVARSLERTIVEAYMIGAVLVHHRQVGSERILLLVGRRRDVELGDAVLSFQSHTLTESDGKELRNILRVQRGVERQLVVLASLKLDVGRDEHVGSSHVVILIGNIRARAIERPRLAVHEGIAVTVEVVRLPEVELVHVGKADCSRYGDGGAYHDGSRRGLLAVVTAGMRHHIVGVEADGGYGLVSELGVADALSHLHVVRLARNVVGQVVGVNPRLILTLCRSRPSDVGIGTIGRSYEVAHRHRVARTYVERHAGTVALSGTVEARQAIAVVATLRNIGVCPRLMSANLGVVDGVNEFAAAVDLDAVELFQRTTASVSLGGVVPFEGDAQRTVLTTSGRQVLRGLRSTGFSHGKLDAVAHEVVAVGILDIRHVGRLKVYLEEGIARTDAAITVGNILRRRVLIHIEVHLLIIVVVDEVAGSLILEGHLTVRRIGTSVLHGADILTVARRGVDLIQTAPVAHAIEVAVVGHRHSADSVRVALGIDSPRRLLGDVKLSHGGQFARCQVDGEQLAATTLEAVSGIHHLVLEVVGPAGTRRTALQEVPGSNLHRSLLLQVVVVDTVRLVALRIEVHHRIIVAVAHEEAARDLVAVVQLCAQNHRVDTFHVGDALRTDGVLVDTGIFASTDHTVRLTALCHHLSRPHQEQGEQR